MNHIVLRPASNSMTPICDPGDARAIIRAGEYTRQTAGIAPEYVHGNLCIVPKELALDFAAFCQRNPKPCPLIGLGSPGNPTLPDLGDIDIRTDLPRYCVFKDGVERTWVPTREEMPSLEPQKKGSHILKQEPTRLPLLISALLFFKFPTDDAAFRVASRLPSRSRHRPSARRSAAPARPAVARAR